MKIKVLRSKISTKQFKKFAFPRYSKKDLENSSGSKSIPSVTKLTLESAPVIYTGIAIIGYFAIKKLKEVTERMRSDPEKFGRCINKLIVTYSDIVRSDGGEVSKFKGTGAFFIFQCGSISKDSAKKALVSALKMRYILNKMNREWDFYREDAWQVGFGLDYGEVTFQEHKEEGIKYISITGTPGKISRGIGLSAGSSQIIITEPMYLQFPFLETAFDVKPPRHVPVKGENFSSKIREIIGMVGPQAKQIYEEYI
ncbi:hypothetical protein IIB79_02595 [candidate division KSB1 bacterium]|nr:hypothetical protein [candidate division KSB1 bacterium]